MHEIVRATEDLVAKLFAAGNTETAGLMQEVAGVLMSMLDVIAEHGLLDEPEPAEFTTA